MMKCHTPSAYRAEKRLHPESHFQKMSEWVYETQSHPVLELDVPLRVAEMNTLITDEKMEPW